MNILNVLLVTIAMGWVVGCASVPSQPFFGEWRVVTFTPAGISALTTAEATERLGTLASYSADLADFGGERCSRPSYARRTLDFQQFYGEFRTHPKDLAKDLDFPEGELTVINITCDREWIVPRRTLILGSHDRLLTLWDGMFFELARQ